MAESKDETIRKMKDACRRTKLCPFSIYSMDYTGQRWTYGLRYRPMQLGAQPRDWIIGSDGPATERYRFGTIQYARKLTEEELRVYEMEEL